MLNSPFKALLTALAFAGALAACEKEGPMEKAGEKVDNVVEQAGDKVEEAAEKVEKATDR